MASSANAIRSSTYTVSDIHSIEHRPQHVELELQDLQGALLLFPRFEVVQRYLKTVLDVASRFRQPLAEVLIALRLDPRVVQGPVFQPFLVDCGREQFGEGRAGRFLPWRAAREVN